MTAITVSNSGQVSPNAGIKCFVVLTDTNAATGYTYDASGQFSTIYATYLCDSTGAVKIATFSGTTVTLGTISTGAHTLILFGI
jgi:hypothetical protein